MNHHSYVYILTNKQNGVLYTGMTSDLHQRMRQHQSGKGSAFARKYHCKQLVYLERCDSIIHAREREHQIKAGSRKKKIALIESINPDWLDLSLTLCEEH